MFSDLREEQQNIIRDLTNKNTELQNCYDRNLQLCKQQEQQINKLATIIEKYRKSLEEIREMVNEPCVPSENDCLTCPTSCFTKDILIKINEVLK